tara:strand:- start:1052 stop:1255 length:204 start_codon:yes stop_codon:yes gene_type:complete
MTIFEVVMLLGGFAAGVVLMSLYYILPLRRLKYQMKKLRGQVYYWSKQLPIKRKPGRPKKKHSCMRM